MSEVQTGITTVNREISVEDLRRAEEDRRAAELADRMRREEEARQHALVKARNTTSSAHAELSNMQLQLNEAKIRLPDLVYSFGSLPEPCKFDLGAISAIYGSLITTSHLFTRPEKFCCKPLHGCPLYSKTSTPG